jgi:hypothetical protein
MTTSLSPFYYHTTMGGYIGFNPQIVHWKPLNTPQGVLSGSIRPLTNKDYTNNTIYKHGSTRPNKTVYRNGYNIANQRFVNSSTVPTGIRQTIDAPGLCITVKDNENDNGISICVSDAIPNYNLTNNPEPFSCSQSFCCNNEKKARRSSYAANTVKKTNYYTNNAQYLYNRNKTYSQNSFHFLKSTDDINVTSSATNSQKNSALKPGGPLSTWENYKFNTNSHCIVGESDGKPCQKEVMYDPNNYKYAKQGAVTDRTHNLSLVLSTLSNASKRRVMGTI